MSEKLLNACAEGNFKHVKKLLNQGKFLKKIKNFFIHQPSYIDINYKDKDEKNALIFACANGHLDVVKYLLTSKDLIEHANINQTDKYDNNVLIYACAYGYLDIVKYLLTSKDLIEHVNIAHCSKTGDNCLIKAAEEGHLEIVEYLLTSKDLKEYPNLYHKNQVHWDVFFCACKNDRINIAQYLLLEHHYKVDDKIINWLNLWQKTEILEIIKIRDLHNKLNSNVPENNKMINKRKI